MCSSRWRKPISNDQNICFSSMFFTLHSMSNAKTCPLPFRIFHFSSASNLMFSHYEICLIYLAFLSCSYEIDISFEFFFLSIGLFYFFFLTHSKLLIFLLFKWFPNYLLKLNLKRKNTHKRLKNKASGERKRYE